ncbi:acyl carrier protein [Acidobacteriota bacterium]
MTAEEIRKELESIITDKINKDISLAEITWETRLREDIGIDSLETVELLFEIEVEFEIKIDDDEAAEMLTVKDAVEAVQKKLEEKGS